MQAPQATQMVPISEWMRRTTIEFMRKQTDALYVSGFVTLSKPEIVALMSTLYEPLMRDTYFISCVARTIMLDHTSGDIIQEGELLRAEMEVNKHIESIHEYFDTRITQAEQKLAMHGMTMGTMQRLEKNYETKTCTNAVTHFFDLLYKADLYLTQLHYLWVTAELSDNSDEAMRLKLNAERDARRQLIGLCQLATEHFMLVRRLCKVVSDGSEAQRKADAARDRAISLEREDRKKELARRATESQAKTASKRKKNNNKKAKKASVQEDIDHVTNIVSGTDQVLVE